jgi:dCMP deaminase
MNILNKMVDTTNEIDKLNQKVQKYMKLARYNADLFSKDPHTKVGAIILTQDFSRILSTGINGFPKSVNDTCEERWQRPTKYSYVAHSEMNAICNAARSGTPIDNSCMVVTMFPCMDCSKAIIQSGIKTIYAPEPDFDDPRWGNAFKISCEMFSEANIEVKAVDT